MAIAPLPAARQDSAATPKAAYNKVIGEVVSVDADGKKLTVKPDTGAPVDVVLDENTSFMLVPPGEKDLRKANRIELKDIGPGDRIYARSHVVEGQSPTPAVSVIVMSKTQVAQHQEKTRDEWQRRGAAGRVTAVDPAAGTITISLQTPAGPKPLVVNTDEKTGFRRYAPDSVKFADAQPGKLADVAPGNNLRVLGDRSADGTSIHAEQVVSGSFRTIAATVISTNGAENEIRVTDLLTKKPLTIRLNADTNVRKLAPMMAMVLARMSGNAPAGAPGMAAPGGAPAAGATPGQNQWQGGAPGGAGPGGPGGGGAGRGDLNRMLERAPQITLADLKPGDALLISSTSGADAGRVTAITIVAGVEAMLAASPTGGRGAGGVGGMWSLDVGLPE